MAISVPDTVLEEKASPREKMTKLGLIARACAIYGVDVIEVFRDPLGRGESKLIRTVLEYLETPQYLRKRLYPLDETLRYAGMLPPLRIPSHKAKVPTSSILSGEVREGVVNRDGTVDIGLDAAPLLEGGGQPGRRVTVKVSSLSPLTARVIQRQQVGSYWGYTVETKTVEESLSDRRFPLKVATSKFGTPVVDTVERLRTALRVSQSVKMIFGSPSRGLFNIVGRNLPGRVDFVVNLFPEQQAETVRTEEAIFASLGIVSLLFAEKA